MRNIKNNLIKCFTFVLVLLCAFSLVSCKKDNDKDKPVKPTEPVKIELNADKDKISESETAKLTVTITGTEDKTYKVTVDNPKIVKVENDVLSVIATVVVDKKVTVTVTANADSNAVASKTFIVKGKTIEGQVGELTSQMLAELGNESITVKGSLKDYYVNFHDSDQNTIHAYSMMVEMSENMWKGSWYSEEDEENVITDIYRKSDKDGLKDQKGDIGHGLERIYINKDNKVASALVKDYLSIPTLWESQHLWNHLAQLNITKFKYDLDNDLYEYCFDYTNEDDLYLMTYLSFSLTPMLEDTLDKVYLKLEDGRITKLLGQTEILYYGADTRDDADAMSYTEIEVTFSKIGTTEIAEPTVYEAPESVELLTKALNEMKSLRNYTFNIVENETYSPSGDSSDYETQSFVTNDHLIKKLTRKYKKVSNYLSSTGKVGLVGKVTADAILLAQTGKYSYAMDDKVYHTEYSGYKKIDDTKYDYFKYDTSAKTLVGQKQVKGSVADVLPKFEFSPNLFILDGVVTKKGKELYTFKINDSVLTRDIALELTVFDYGKNGAASAYSTLKLVVDEEGHLVSATIPYSFMSGTYLGYYEVTYTKFNETTLDDDTFDGYVARVWRTSWSQFTTKSYSETFDTRNSHDEDTNVVLEAIFGKDAAASFFAPTVFMDVFGDCIFGPFYSWKTKGTDASGNDIQTGFLEIRASSEEFDENGQITNYDELMSELRKAFEKEGFKYSVENSDTTGGETGKSDRYVCFIKGDVQVVVQNNHTRHFFIYVYKTGDWKLNK